MKSMHRALTLFAFYILFDITASAQGIYSSLDYVLKNPTATSVSIFPEEEQIGLFISKISEFEDLKKLHFNRYSGNPQSNLVLATISNIDQLQTLKLELLDLNQIPPYLDEFEGLQELIITPNSGSYVLQSSEKFVLLNGNNNLIVEVQTDQQTALDFMDQFIDTYPAMAPNLENFRTYIPNPSLRRVEKSYQSFQPYRLPQTQSALIDPTIASKIITDDGSIISIPALAFVDDNNNMITDSVQIDVSYFNDQLDMALAQLPMTVNQSESSDILESAGMFEINASLKGAFLALAPNQVIEMTYNSNQGGNYNIYRFEDDQSQWALVEENNRSLAQTTDVFTPAYLRYNDLIQRVSYTALSEPTDYDESKFFLSEDYLRFENRYETAWGAFNLEDEEKRTQLHKHYRMSARSKGSKAPLIILDRERSAHRVLRPHTFFKIDELNNAFNELRPLRKFLWYTSDTLSSASFRSKYGRQVAYVDFRLSYEASGEQFKFVLKSVSGDFDTLYAKPWLSRRKLETSNAAEHLAILKSYEKAFRSVSQRKVKAKESSEHKYARSYRAQIEKQTNRERSAWTKVQARMLPQEQAMSFEEWHANYMNLRRLYDQVMMTKYNAIRTLTLDKMGMWNCDNPMLQDARFKTVNILANVDESSEPRISVLFLDFNSSLTTGQRSKTDTQGECAYLIFDEEDNISWITPDEAKRRKSNELHVKQEFIPITSLNVDALRQELFSSL